MFDFKEIKKKISKEKMIDLVVSLGAETYEDRESFVIFPTICHNHRDHSKSMKMYYYVDSGLFKCYTECDEAFDIFDLYKKVANLDGFNKTMYEIVDEISRKTGFSFDDFNSILRYKAPLEARKKGATEYTYQTHDNKILNFFEDRKINLWLKEGITYESTRKFNIRFYPYRNKIVIPHYDIADNLIGIRVRNIEEEDLFYGKYMPIQMNGQMYSHPLSFNLYGLNVTKEAIRKNKIVCIFEGEKSVLKMDSYFGNDNISVATCGSTLNRFQIMLLKKHTFVDEIVICFDREFETEEEEESYFNKLYSIGEKYSNYCKISFIFDDKRLLGYKDSPVDKGKDIFTKLLSERRIIRSY